MDIVVKHDLVDITDHVLSYNREAKICTGIGMLELAVDYTYSGSFLTWDSIDIYEEGSHAGTYYISSTANDQPNPVITVIAQDNSKRLSDYFITDSYVVDYQSNAKEWIIKFLDEVGVTYEFVSSGNGGVLSNNTSLGLTTAYEQIITLLQMSGWYIKFNSDGVAIIGELTLPPRLSVIEAPCSGIFTGSGLFPDYGEFPYSGSFAGSGLFPNYENSTGSDTFTCSGISTFTGTFPGSFPEPGDFSGYGIFTGSGIFIGSGVFPNYFGSFDGTETFTESGIFTDNGVFPLYSEYLGSGIFIGSGNFTCDGIFPASENILVLEDVLEAAVIKNDRMYRNRIVVWGNGDSGGWVFADVSKSSKWDYDELDKRTVVIANSNIPNKAKANNLANKALLEFGKLTVEKTIVADGSLPLEIGDMLALKTKVFTGTDMITTFGVSMSKMGLTTNITMGERCPRLFGFFRPIRQRTPPILPLPSGDLGVPVYVGTDGDGIWRKIASGWYPYSSGLMDMSVTDFHINQGVMASVTSDGTAYYSIEDSTPWIPISISGLETETIEYSGLMSRACIIDRDSNRVRVAVDNRSGANYGDFLTETDPMNPDYYPMFAYDAYSGYLESQAPWSGVTMRSWVLDVNPYDGSKTEYPIALSGNYEFYSYDIENDGTHDYIEAMTVGSGVILQDTINGYYAGANSFSNPLYVFAAVTYGTPLTNTSMYNDGGAYKNLMPYSGFPIPEVQYTDTLSFTTWHNPATSTTTRGCAYLEDNMPTSSGYIAWAESDSVGKGVLKVAEVYYDGAGELSYVLHTASENDFPAANVRPGLITRDSANTFSFYEATVQTLTPDVGYMYKSDYDIFYATVTGNYVAENLPTAYGCISYGPVPAFRAFDAKLFNTNLYYICDVDGLGFW